MKRKLNLWLKVKILYQWLKGTGKYGIIEVCGYCDSMKIDIKHSNTTDRIYTATYECKSCGAMARVRETWYGGY